MGLHPVKYVVSRIIFAAASAASRIHSCLAYLLAVLPHVWRAYGVFPELRTADDIRDRTALGRGACPSVHTKVRVRCWSNVFSTGLTGRMQVHRTRSDAYPLRDPSTGQPSINCEDGFELARPCAQRRRVPSAGPRTQATHLRAQRAPDLRRCAVCYLAVWWRHLTVPIGPRLRHV